MCSPSIRTSPSPASSSGMRAADPAARATSTGDTLGVVPKARLVSLDVFRGLTVAAMVLVNNPGTWRAVYAPLRHADWHGWTPTDLIFPFFLFILGVAIPLALGRRLRDEGRAGIVLRILRRAAIIFALGLVLHAVSNFDAATIRLPGVLQR